MGGAYVAPIRNPLETPLPYDPPALEFASEGIKIPKWVSDAEMIFAGVVGVGTLVYFGGVAVSGWFATHAGTVAATGGGGVVTTGLAKATPTISKATTAMQPYYPPNNGFMGSAQKVVIKAGTYLQRTGDLGGRFTAPAGTPEQLLSLPYDKIGQSTTILQTQQPLQALSGQVAPWFGQIGGGTQYLLLDGSVKTLVENDLIRIIGG